jgi:hypothetical protein
LAIVADGRQLDLSRAENDNVADRYSAKMRVVKRKQHLMFYQHIVD